MLLSGVFLALYDSALSTKPNVKSFIVFTGPLKKIIPTLKLAGNDQDKIVPSPTEAVSMTLSSLQVNVIWHLLGSGSISHGIQSKNLLV